MRFVDIEEARAAAGLRLVIAGNVPSPWSQAAMGIFDIKGIDYLGVLLRPAAEAIRVWTGSHNAPVAVYDTEPPRTGWAEILPQRGGDLAARRLPHARTGAPRVRNARPDGPRRRPDLSPSASGPDVRTPPAFADAVLRSGVDGVLSLSVLAIAVFHLPEHDGGWTRRSWPAS